MNLSLMGPFFNINCLPDLFGSGLPPVRDVLKCARPARATPAPASPPGSALSHPAPRRRRRPTMKRHELESGIGMVRGYLVQLQGTLHDVLKALLVVEKGAVREEVLAWIGEFITANAGRGKLQIEPMSCATHGAFVNFCAVMLRLCAP